MKTYTHIDVQVAAALYSELINLIHDYPENLWTGYEWLLDQCKSTYGDVAEVAHCIAEVSCRKRLRLVREYTQAMRLPDISALVSTEEDFDDTGYFLDDDAREYEREKCRGMDWQREGHEAFMQYVRTRVRVSDDASKRPVRLAEELMLTHYWKYYSQEPLKISGSMREAIVYALTLGQDVDDVFRQQLFFRGRS
jgi:hypothetical protein